MNNLKLGSLFDGSGGFPFGAILNGITPIWASEIEPFPIRVTTKRIPDMKHLGDISKINGGEIEPVDIITFGSPCQDLSLAGKRNGLEGKKSNLFYEAIRIIREMREKTNGQSPRFIVWENVPGAYSSAKGKDFRCVLEEIVKIKDEALSIPMPEKNKWLLAGEILGDDFSVAWRTLDAQFWGVPQRRRRIYLVSDFGGHTAPKILFESEGLLGDIKESQKPRQRAAGDVRTSTTPTISFQPGAMSRLGKKPTEEVTSTLLATMGDNRSCVAFTTGSFMTVNTEKTSTLAARDYKDPPCVFENHSQDTRYKGPLEKAQAISATYGMGGNNQPFVVSDTPKTLKVRSGCEGGGKGALIQDNKSATLSCNNDQSVFVPKAYGICSDRSNSMKSDNPASGIYEAETSRTIDANGINPSANQGGIAVVSLQGSMIGRKDENGPNGSGINENVSFCLNCTDKHGVVYALDRESFNSGANFARNMGVAENGIASTLNAQGPSAVSSADLSYTVRRLTPLECCRLQGFPDYWCQNLETENPTDEDITFWREVFETHRVIMGKSSKPKSYRQIIKWLKNPHSISAEYSMWGNGVALPCVVYVLGGIAEQVKTTQ